MAVSFSWASSKTNCSELPPAIMPRLAPVPPPAGRMSVSLCRTWTSAGVTPSMSAVIWANVVAVPWPWGETPVWTVTSPDWSTITLECSPKVMTLAPEPLTTVAIPTPISESTSWGWLRDRSRQLSYSEISSARAKAAS